MFWFIKLVFLMQDKVVELIDNSTLFFPSLKKEIIVRHEPWERELWKQVPLWWTDIGRDCMIWCYLLHQLRLIQIVLIAGSRTSLSWWYRLNTIPLNLLPELRVLEAELDSRRSDGAGSSCGTLPTAACPGARAGKAEKKAGAGITFITFCHFCC